MLWLLFNTIDAIAETTGQLTSDGTILFYNE